MSRRRGCQHLKDRGRRRPRSEAGAPTPGHPSFAEMLRSPNCPACGEMGEPEVDDLEPGDDVRSWFCWDCMIGWGW